LIEQGNSAHFSRIRLRVVRHSHVAILKISNKIVNNLGGELGDHRRRACGHGL